MRRELPQETTFWRGVDRSQGSAQPDTQLFPIIVVRPADSKNPPSRISQVLIAQYPVALGLFELDASFSEFCNSIEFNDEVQVFNEDIDVVVVAAYPNMHLRFGCERADGSYQPEKRSFSRVGAAWIDGFEDRASTSVAANVASSVEASKQLGADLFSSLAALILMEH